MHEAIREDPTAQLKERSKPSESKRWKEVKLTYEQRKDKLKVGGCPLSVCLPACRPSICLPACLRAARPSACLPARMSDCARRSHDFSPPALSSEFLHTNARTCVRKH